jgi:hypothetical protein
MHSHQGVRLGTKALLVFLTHNYWVYPHQKAKKGRRKIKIETRKNIFSTFQPPCNKYVKGQMLILFHLLALKKNHYYI